MSKRLDSYFHSPGQLLTVLASDGAKTRSEIALSRTTPAGRYDLDNFLKIWKIYYITYLVYKIVLNTCHLACIHVIYHAI